MKKNFKKEIKTAIINFLILLFIIYVLLYNDGWNGNTK